MTYISSQSLLSPVRQSVLQAQSALSQAQSEISTGRKDDLGLQLGAHIGTSLSLQAQVDQLNAYSDSNSFAKARLDTTTTTMTSILSSAQSISAHLLTAATAGGTTALLRTSAEAALQSLTSGLNTSVGGQYIFAGINTSQQPIADYASTPPSAAKQAVDAAFTQTFQQSPTSSGTVSITGSQMNQFLDGAFDAQFSDANWQNWSKATNATIQTSVAPTQKATTSVSANQAAFRNVTEAYTMLSEYTGPNFSADAQAAVVKKATSLLSAGIAGLTQVQSDVGVTQASVDLASSQINARIGVMKTNVSDLDDVDTYTLSSRVSSLQTQLEASYELTSRLQQLSLVNYING